MQNVNTIAMPRLIKLAERNRNGGWKVLLTTAALVTATCAAFVGITILTSGL